MLSIWKQTRNKEGRAEDSEEINGQTDGQEINDDERAPNKDDRVEEGRPTKRRKTENISPSMDSGNDNISNTLPEIMDLDQSDSLRDASNVSLEAQPATPETIVAAAKQNNMIAVFESNTQMLSAASELALWSSAIEREKPKTKISLKPKVTVVVVENSGLASVRASQLSSKAKLSIGVYTSSQESFLDQWDTLLSKDAIIIAADMFLDCLRQGAIAFSQINLIIIDDVQAVKLADDHSVRQAMQDFYFVTESLSRPRIFACLLVPSVSKVVFDFPLLKLEIALDSKVFGVPESVREAIRSIPDKPMEIVVFYEPQILNLETTLHIKIRSLDKKMEIPGMRRVVRNARLALSEVGPCGCDFVWRRSLDELDLDGDEEAVYEEEDEIPDGSPVAIAKAKARVREVIRNWTFLMPNLDPQSRGFNVTPKALQLIKVLMACKPEGDSFRGIIFVQYRAIAYVLSDMLRAVDDKMGFLRLQVLTGHGPSSQASSQNDIIEGFRSGVHNLLVCTKQAEELDLSPATLVVRFDLFESYVSYAHARTRGRGRESHLVHMAERGSDVHLRILSQLAGINPDLELWLQKVAKSPTSAVPPQPLNDTIDPYRSDSEDEREDTSQFIRDPTTSGKIYVRDAVTALYRFLSLLEHPKSPALELDTPLFEYEELQAAGLAKPTVICTVLLPRGAPISRVSGAPSSTYAEARRQACFQTCLQFFQRGLLDYRLFPRPPLPNNRAQRARYISAHLMDETSDRGEEDDFMPEKLKQGQSRSAGMRRYPRKKPDFWENSLPVMRGCLYPTIVTPIVSSEGAAAEEYTGPFRPMLLLTRLPMPPLLAFKLFFSGVPGQVHLTRGAAFDVDEDRMKELYRYTIRVIRFITNKPFVCAPESMTYFIAPLSSETWKQQDGVDDGSLNKRGPWDFREVVDHIPWDSVQCAANNAAVTLNTQDLDSLTKDTADALIQDRWVEFTRRYVCVKMRPDLSPLSKPSDSPRESNYESLLDYCRVRRKGFEGLRNENQPLIEVTRAPLVINHLNPNSTPTAPPKRLNAKYLIPEFCVKCSLPASVFRTATLLPAILHRIDDMLLVKEINAKFFDHSIDETQLHAAITSPSAAADFDYERLELLGDAYLKYLSSVYLFVTFPTQSEGMLHILRQKIISNRSLLRNSVRCGLPQYIQSKGLAIKIWAPPNFKIYYPPKHRPEEPVPQQEENQSMDVDEAQQEEKVKVEEEEPENPLRSRDPTPSVEAEPEVAHESEREVSNLPPENENVTQAEEPKGEDIPYRRRRKTMSKKMKQEKENDIQWLGDKSVADVAEAIIGAAYVTKGREIALKVTKALNIPVPHIDRWSDFGKKALAPSPEVTAKLKDGSIEAVEKIMGHKFNHPHLLAQALTHASVHGNEMTSYERLEFLGDAIVDFLVIRHIFDRDGMLSPGALTLLKGAMVSNATLAAVCVWAGLHEHLLFESHVLASDIQAYADNLKSRQEAEYTRAQQEGRMPGQYWMDVEPPKALSDVVESIVGAVYVSDNFSPVGSEAFFDRVLKPFYDQHITLRTLSHHPTKVLFELFQSQGCQQFEITKEAVTRDANDHTAQCSIVVHDVVLSSATDTSASSAARRASFMALDAIEGDPGFLPRTCSCRANNATKKRAKKATREAFMDVDDADEKLVESVLS